MPSTGYTTAEWAAFNTRRKSWTEYSTVNPYVFATELALAHAPLGRLLDLACGDSRDFFKIDVRDYFEYTGIDLSDEAAQEHDRNTVSHAAFIHEDVNTVQLDANQFSVVTSMFGMYHFEHPDKVIERAAEWLIPGGLFIAFTIDSDSLSNIFHAVGGPSIPVPVQERFQIDEAVPLVEEHLDIVTFGTYIAPTDFKTTENVRKFLASTMTYEHLADYVDESTPTKGPGVYSYIVGRKR